MFCKLPVAKRNFTKRHSHLPDQGGKKAPEPTSEEGQRILEELEQPVRLSKREVRRTFGRSGGGGVKK